MINKRFAAQSEAEGKIMHKNCKEAVGHKSSDFLSNREAKELLRGGSAPSSPSACCRGESVQVNTQRSVFIGLAVGGGCKGQLVRG